MAKVETCELINDFTFSVFVTFMSNGLIFLRRYLKIVDTLRKAWSPGGGRKGRQRN